MRRYISPLGRPALRAAALLAAAASAAGVVGCGPPQGPNLRYADRLVRAKKVAVMPFVDAPGDAAKGSGRIVVNAIVRSLLHCPDLQVIERTRINSILDERRFRTSQLSDPGVASQVGKLAGADLVFLGEVTQYEAQQEYGHAAVYVIAGGSTEHIHRVGLSVRAVDVSDGTTVYAELGQGVDKKGFSEAAKRAADKVLEPLQRFYAARSRSR